MDVLSLSFIIKLLLLPAYRSTDFQVHRNWLAITANLPLYEWYFEAQSQWTLDYPPFFAYFEYVLGQIAKRLDPSIVTLDAHDHHDWHIVLFQRLSVIASELVLGYSCLRLAQLAKKNHTLLPCLEETIPLSLFLHPALIIIDHIHFQYNGFLLGLFLLSCIAFKENNLLWGAFLFSSLLCFKHIYLYIAPAYFAYLLRAYCFPDGWHKLSVRNLLQLGCVTLVPPLLALGPFVGAGVYADARGISGRGALEQISAIFARLFPFTRGLCHSLWAANFWALWTLTDRLLILVAQEMSWSVKAGAQETSTKGLVGDTVFGILPQIEPRHTMLLTLAFQFAGISPVLRHPSYTNFLRAVVNSAYASFLLAWHVHEKAFLLIAFPMTLLLMEDMSYARNWMILSLSGTVACMPLLTDTMSTPVKILLTALWTSTFVALVRANSPRAPRSMWGSLLDRLDQVYFAGLFAIIFLLTECTTLQHVAFPLILHKPVDAYPFLTVVVTASYCAFGVMFSRIQAT